jgi:hypothetical protein
VPRKNSGREKDLAGETAGAGIAVHVSRVWALHIDAFLLGDKFKIPFVFGLMELSIHSCWAVRMTWLLY